MSKRKAERTAKRGKKVRRELTGELYFSALFLLISIIYALALITENSTAQYNEGFLILVSFFIIGLFGLVDGLALRQRIYSSLYSFMIRKRQK